MKGIELPINVLIIVAIAIIVLIALVAMFYPAFSSGSTTTSLEAAKSTACMIYTDKNCPNGFDFATIYVDNFDANKDGKINPGKDITNPSCSSNRITSWAPGGDANDCDNLYTLCAYYYGCAWDSNDPNSNFRKCCAQVCGC